MGETSIKNIYTGLICLHCGKDDLVIKKDIIECKKCPCNYPIIDSVPILLNEDKSIFLIDDFTKKRNLFFDISTTGNVRKIVSNILPNIGGNNVARQNFNFIKNKLLEKIENPRILVLGASIEGEGITELLNSDKLTIIESDVSFGPRTQIILDAHTIPYLNEQFDCVIAQAVLEHVVDPFLCVEEIFRVLKPNGLVYIETPFMQQVHGGPYDFMRFSHSGHRLLLKNFKEIKSGIIGGPGTVLLWAYQYLFLSLFGYTNALKLLIKIFTRLTGFWLKWIDKLPMNKRIELDCASGYYFIGEKNKESFNIKNIINYYYSI